MPIGWIRPITIVASQITRDRRSGDRERRSAEARVQPLTLAPRGVARRAVALVELPGHAVEPRDRPLDLVA